MTDVNTGLQQPLGKALPLGLRRAGEQSHLTEESVDFLLVISVLGFEAKWETAVGRYEVRVERG